MLTGDHSAGNSYFHFAFNRISFFIFDIVASSVITISSNTGTKHFKAPALAARRFMDATLINPCIDATLNILGTIAGITARIRPPLVKSTNAARGEITGVIQLTGEANGIFSVSFSRETILSVVSTMFGEQMNEINADIQDAVGEIINMISGRITQSMEQMGRSLKAQLATVVMGTDQLIAHISGQPVIAIPFDTEVGPLTIEFSMVP
jgi:chemotaxis protein CheX